jgi:hypothetical protein
MFYMPGTRMLFGDAKDSCDGKFLPVAYTVLSVLTATQAIKRGLESRIRQYDI